MKLSDKQFLEQEIEWGITPDNKQYLKLQYGLADWIYYNFRPESLYEIGPGVGTLLERMLELGVDAYGYDPSNPHRDFFTKRNPQYKDHYLEGVDDRVINPDVLVSIEVFEHLTDEEVNNYLYLTDAKHIVFSSTPHPDPATDEQWGHINIKEPEDWDEIFAEHGYKPMPKRPPITAWAKVYKKD